MPKPNASDRASPSPRKRPALAAAFKDSKLTGHPLFPDAALPMRERQAAAKKPGERAETPPHAEKYASKSKAGLQSRKRLEDSRVMSRRSHASLATMKREPHGNAVPRRITQKAARKPGLSKAAGH